MEIDNKRINIYRNSIITTIILLKPFSEFKGYNQMFERKMSLSSCENNE